MNSKLELLEEFRMDIVKKLFTEIKEEVENITDEDGCIPEVTATYKPKESNYKLKLEFQNDKGVWIALTVIEVNKNDFKIRSSVNTDNYPTILKNHYASLEHIEKVIEDFQKN